MKLFYFFSFYLVSVLLYAENVKMQYNNFVYISGGSYIPLFKEGDYTIVHNVNEFFIDTFFVTNIEYRKFIKNNIKWHNNKIKSVFSDANYLIHWSNFIFIQNSPVVNVSWYACDSYCKSYNKRLPVIDEWEYILQNYIDNDYIHQILNWYTKPIKDILCSRESVSNNYNYNYNVYGMSGIIWEWVEDFNSIIIIGSDSEGGDSEQLLFCGTAAVNSSNPSDYVAFMRFAFRSSLQAKYNISSLGFRCVKNI
ncbi:MAG: formylglycine-generating enzyme family protein [Candidatus Azosocius agrarius]|nr:MAG: formylglycine-generating enzyme family protein [Gammaproteobacteria bacterium]